MTKSIKLVTSGNSIAVVKTAIAIISDKSIARTLSIRERSLVNKKLRQFKTVLPSISSSLVLV